MSISWFKNIIEKIKLTFDFKKVNSPSLKIENKADGVKTQIGQLNIQRGLTYSEVKDLVISVVDQKLISFHDEAKTIYDKRTDEFKKLLMDKIKDLPEEEIVKLKEPDTQLTLVEAAKISGRKQNEELRNLLANLVISRIKNDKSGKEELKNIVYNEAISTVNKLTVDQLKIITVCYLLKYTSYNGIVSWDTFRNYLNTHIKPFLNFKNTNAEFQHIEYAGCGSIGIGSWNLINIYKQQYSFLFFNLVEKDQIDGLALSDEIKNEIFVLDVKEDKYFVRFKNKTELDKYFKNKKIDKEIIIKLVSIYENHIKNNEEIKKKIVEETDIGKELIDLWEKSVLKHLSLTSVGIAIGASYFEQIVGEKIDIGIWIN
ncbi:MAG: LPO_1073/Vpar_1526 family protein [Patescibacteria group bacterium]